MRRHLVLEHKASGCLCGVKLLTISVRFAPEMLSTSSPSSAPPDGGCFRLAHKQRSLLVKIKQHSIVLFYFARVPSPGISFPTGTVQVSYFLKAKPACAGGLLENILNLFESWTQGAQASCSRAQKTPNGVFSFVPSPGFEPGLPAPQAGVLSIELRGRKNATYTSP